MRERRLLPVSADTAQGAPADDIAELAEATIAKGSQSFAAAARLFDGRTRESAVMLYQWCRHCDDVIDDQDLGRPMMPLEAPRSGAAHCDPAARLVILEEQTRRAFAGQAVEDPNFRALQIVALRHDVPLSLALDHLEGFRMDVEGRHYGSIEDTLDYCHHVAGVVGMMMARVMGARDPLVMQRAADLGIAFQLTNIARDIVPDAAAGRVYLPQDWLSQAGLARSDIGRPQARATLAGLAERLVATAEPYYASARIGIDALPRRSAWAVATALGVYRQIGMEVVARGDRAWDERVATSRVDKLRHVVLAAGIAAQPRRRVSPPRPRPLWTHADINSMADEIR